MLARLRHRAWHARNDTREVHDRLVRSHAAGAGSFLDVGCMWRIDGANSFAAEEAGAANVTALDIMGATAAFEERHRAVGSRVRFVQGDVNDPGIVEAHGVVWCSGVLYHVPDPLLTLRRLRELTLDRLLLATEVLPGRRRGAVFLPTRRDHPGAPDVAPDDAAGYAPWYWLPTAPAVRSMLAMTGFAVDDEAGLGPFHRVFSARAAG
jgi:SAM-dependent methyltransferase